MNNSEICKNMNCAGRNKCDDSPESCNTIKRAYPKKIINTPLLKITRHLEKLKIFEREKIEKFTDASNMGKCAMSRIHLINSIGEEVKEIFNIEGN